MQVQVSLTIEMGASASLAEMEQQVQEIGQQAMREAFKQTIREWEEQQQACPHCGGKQRRLEGTVRRVIATLFGRVQVPRRRFRCLGCGRRWCPANALLAELQGGTVSRPLQEAAWLAGCSWPYRAASATLKRLCGADISAEEIRRLANRQGKLRAAQQQAEAERVGSEPTQEPAATEQADPPLLVGVDGGWVGSREQRGGMEGKVAVVSAQVANLPLPKRSSTFSWSQRGPRGAPRQRHHLMRRRYVATFGPSAHLGQLAKAAARTESRTGAAPGGAPGRWSPVDPRPNKPGTSRKPPAFWTGRISGARCVMPSGWRPAPSRCRRTNMTTSCICIGRGSGMARSIKRCKACLT